MGCMGYGGLNALDGVSVKVGSGDIRVDRGTQRRRQDDAVQNHLGNRCAGRAGRILFEGQDLARSRLPTGRISVSPMCPKAARCSPT